MTEASASPVVLVTGASSGIGAAVARRFAGVGARLILAARRQGRLEALATELGVPALVLPLDVRDRAAVERAVAELPERFAAIDVLVNCAGGVAWSDAGRIVTLGGLDFLLAELAAGNLAPSPRGLAIRRVEASDGAGPKRCTYHGPQGCTIPPDRRSATCNYYVCDDALAEAGADHGAPDAPRARSARDTLEALYARWDGELAGRVATRWPRGAPWDAGFLGWLGDEYTRFARGTPGVLLAARPQ
jgi:hypothetical protein